MAAVAVHEYLPGAAAGPAYAFFIGLADIDPEFDLAGQIFLPEIRLVIGAQALAER